MRKLLFSGLFICLLVLSIIPNSHEMDIPPTNAFAKIHSDNGTVNSKNYSMPVTITGTDGITVNSNDNSHKVIIKGAGNCTATTITDQTSNRVTNTIYHNTSGKTMLVIINLALQVLVKNDFAGVQLNYDSVNPPLALNQQIGLENDDAITDMNLVTVQQIIINVPVGWFYQLVDTSVGTGNITIISWQENQNPSCGTGTSAFSGTYNQTQANGNIINTNGHIINFVNGTGATVKVLNSNSGQRVNVTISATGTAGVTQLNGFTGKVNITRGAVTNMSSVTNSSGTIKYQMKPNVVLTNGSKQFFSKDLDFGQSVKDIFANAGMYIRNVASTFTYNIIGGVIGGNYTLTLPPITGNDILPALNLSQNFTKKQSFTQTSTTAPINIQGTTATPTSPRKGDIFFNGFDLRWNNVIDNATFTAMTTTTTQTIPAVKTISGAWTFSNNQTVSTGQNLYMGTANVSTTAVRGYLYLSTTDGTPTGTPASHTGGLPVVVDGKTNRLCIYFTSWKCVTLS